MASRLVCVRHAPTLGAGRCIGRTDIRTTLSHEMAADRMAEALTAWCGSDLLEVGSVWSSSLSRCRIPAERLAEAFGIQARIDRRLLEVDFGSWEGRSWEQLEREDSQRLAAWMENWQTLPPPGGESLDALMERVSSWWADRSDSDGLHVLVAHAGVVRALLVIAGSTWEAAMARPVPHLEALAPFEQ